MFRLTVIIHSDFVPWKAEWSPEPPCLFSVNASVRASLGSFSSHARLIPARSTARSRSTWLLEQMFGTWGWGLPAADKPEKPKSQQLFTFITLNRVQTGIYLIISYLVLSETRSEESPEEAACSSTNLLVSLFFLYCHILSPLWKILILCIHPVMKMCYS